MAAVAGEVERSGRALSPGGGGRSPDTWKRHIVRQLQHRDRDQHVMFQDLIRVCTNSVWKTVDLLAFQVLELQQQIKTKDCVLEEQHARLLEEQRRSAVVLGARGGLQERVEQVQEENGALKLQYDALLARQRGAETRLREEKVREGHLLEDVIHLKRQAAAHMNSRNERRSRARDAKLQKELQTAARSKVTIERSTSRSSSPKKEKEDQTPRHTRLFRATLDGSTGGITCVEFDPTGSRVLAASYDESALLWRLDDSAPKLTLTGHKRKVTAARFSSSLHQVVTGSADRTIRLWDLHRAACVQVVEVASYCSDLVCSENWIISGHFDCKIRLWDTRAASCVQELPAQGKVTSLDLGSDRRQLLSCCRDDCLQLVDLRRWSNDRVSFRAEGFKCGSDSTRAVISPDGCFLAAGSADGAVYIWNVSTGNLETRLPDKHSSSISAVSWSPSGEYVVSVDKSRRAVLWSDI
ncbi:hypothetical protein F2P81_017722 [Scophthalmus maximus]|uniref:Uncharacterized protein n=1 Tax=Scophthalmus maximus TaxID=52904 RepID=A0A6A4SIN3_SCOMX|nr:hypothetical protein F2P81_017722 [Scophthalmus maximus]